MTMYIRHIIHFDHIIFIITITYHYPDSQENLAS